MRRSPNAVLSLVSLVIWSWIRRPLFLLDPNKPHQEVNTVVFWSFQPRKTLSILHVMSLKDSSLNLFHYLHVCVFFQSSIKTAFTTTFIPNNYRDASKVHFQREFNVDQCFEAPLLLSTEPQHVENEQPAANRADLCSWSTLFGRQGSRWLLCCEYWFWTICLQTHGLV